jgi:hypothetical protein
MRQLKTAPKVSAFRLPDKTDSARRHADPGACQGLGGSLRRTGMHVQRVLTDNGSAYRSKLFARTCQTPGIKRSFT